MKLLNIRENKLSSDKFKNWLCILVVLPLLTQGQNNFVPNGNFENHSECPSNSAQITLATPWYSAMLSPDYYHACNPSIPYPDVGTPENSVGFQFPHSGDAYAGIFGFSRFSHNLREFLQVELSDTIIKGIPYVVSFWLSLADGEKYSISTMGAYVSEQSINETHINTFDIIPQIMNNPTYPLDDKENWMLITDTFISNVGGERYITIGNFFDDANSDTIFLNSGEYNRIYAYYYIDDVSVIPVDTTIGIEDYINNKVKVYPNPVNESFIVEYLEQISGEVVFELFDVSGRKVIAENIYTNRTFIETGSLDAGIYHYALRENEFIKYSGKQIIIR